MGRRGRLVPLISETPGFDAYYLVNAGNGVIVSISYFTDRAGAEESTRVAAQWVGLNLVELVRRHQRCGWLSSVSGLSDWAPARECIPREADATCLEHQVTRRLPTKRSQLSAQNPVWSSVVCIPCAAPRRPLLANAGPILLMIQIVDCADDEGIQTGEVCQQPPRHALLELSMFEYAGQQERVCSAGG
jgi:hypothetical protein